MLKAIVKRSILLFRRTISSFLDSATMRRGRKNNMRNGLKFTVARTLLSDDQFFTYDLISGIN